MMTALFGITEFETVEIYLISIPESFGLLLFGIGLVILAVLTRSLLCRPDSEKMIDENVK